MPLIIDDYFSYFWGFLSDQIGRKPVMIISGIYFGISTLLFGFTVNFAMAVVTRFLIGFGEGMILNIIIIVVTSTYTCTHHTCTHAHTHIHMHIHMYIHAHIHMHTHSCTHSYTCRGI